MSIRIPQEVHDWLRSRAFTERRSINAVVAQILTDTARIPTDVIPEHCCTHPGTGICMCDCHDQDCTCATWPGGVKLRPVSQTPETR